MPKNIVVCCDGTGNQYGDANSNVIKLYSTLLVNSAQAAYYHPGIGTMGAPTASNKVEEFFKKVNGLAFGAGLLDNVADAYRYLMNTYREGDEIYLFGFSRGAFTVRALSGMLYMFGLLCPGNEGMIPYVVRMFARLSRAQEGSAPTLCLEHQFEKQGTGTDEATRLANGFKNTFSRKDPDFKVRFVGVWDTVESMGFLWDPVVLSYQAQNPLYRTMRHALAIDEHRSFFEPTLWGDPLQTPDGVQDVKQVWFAGVHSDVGGSYPEAESGLSKITLEWMLLQAMNSGLHVDPDRAAKVLSDPPPDPRAPIHESLKGTWELLELLFRKDDREHTAHASWRRPGLGKRRVIPPGSTVHETVWQRIASVPGYRPRNLPPKDPLRVEPRVALAENSRRTAA
jgi:uncharacterized protein (DUF2235 family)